MPHFWSKNKGVTEHYILFPMKKVFFQFLVLVILFLTLFGGLSSIDFMKYWHLQSINRRTEDKIGQLVIDGIKKSNKEINNDSVQVVLNTIKSRICIANSISPADIAIHLVRSDEVNAFAIPGHHIIIYTGLIDRCDSVSELCGVIGHEMGHIQLNHVMKRLLNELGIGLLAAVASNGNSAVIGQIIKILSSTAFARKQESEADKISVRYLEQAHINPKGFANIMLKLADMHAGIPKEMEWISTHPDSKKRADTILSIIHADQSNYTPVLTGSEWLVLKNTANSGY